MELYEMIKALEEKHIFAVPSEEFDGRAGGIWVKSWEKEKCLPFSYASLSWDFRNSVYTMGVENKLYKFLEDNGWSASPYDSGTWFLYRTNN